MVITGHVWPLTGASGVPTLAGIRIHHLGVYIFFVISGYLLAVSWDRDPRAAPFMIRRCLRIFPALVVVVALTVFVLGPAVTTVPAAAYWASGETWRYLLSMTLLAQYELPGVFESNPEPVVNGSLWSLGIEFCCYAMLVASALRGLRARIVIRGMLVVGIGSVVLAGVLVGPMRTTAIAVVFFLIGSLAAKGGVLAQWPLWPALAGIAAIAPLQGWLGTLLAWPVVAYAVVAIGSGRSRAARVVRSIGDPSYGMYLWGFLIQQLLIWRFAPLPLLADVVIVLVLSACAGYASWHLVEKHAIALGGRLSHPRGSTSSRRRSPPSPRRH